MHLKKGRQLTQEDFVNWTAVKTDLASYLIGTLGLKEKQSERKETLSTPAKADHGIRRSFSVCSLLHFLLIA